MQAIGAEKLNRLRYGSVLLALQILLLPASLLVISTLLTLSNITFTGLVYGLVITGLSWLSVFVIDRDRQRRFVIYVSTAVLIAVVVIGYQPYITNIIHKGTPGVKIHIK
jgi:hypothetical protein